MSYVLLFGLCGFCEWPAVYTALITPMFLPLRLYVLTFGFSIPCSKECLVSSSGNDNTENGLSGAKADNKGTPKA